MKAAAGRPATILVALGMSGALALCALVPAVEAAARPKKAAATSSTKAKTSSQAKSDQVLAWIAGKPLTRAELEERLDQISPQFRQQFTTPEGRKQLLDRMIQEQVWTLAAERAGVSKRPEVVRQIDQTRRDIIVRAYLGEVMQSVPSPGDSAIKAYYEAHKSEPQLQMPEARRLRHIQVESEKEAKEVLRRLGQGSDFATLAKQLSKDAGTRDQGGEIGRLERAGGFGNLGRQPALAESAFRAPIGVPVGPVHSTLGWHVLLVEEKLPPAPMPLENVRPRIVQMLNRDTQEQYYQTQLDRAKASVGFRMNQAVVDSFLYGHKTSAELFHDAQQAATPDERIAAYEKVVSEFPQSEHAPQARFMIGFIYSEEKKDYDKAEAEFKKLLADYPRSELRNSAQWMIEHMRTEAVPDFELPGGVKRSTGSIPTLDVRAARPDTTRAPGVDHGVDQRPH